MSEETPQPELEDYPINTGDYLKLIDAYTLYKWDEHWWMAVAVVETKYGRSLRGYKWQWRQPNVYDQEKGKRVSKGQPRWFLNQKLNFNSRDQWDEFVETGNEMLSLLPEEEDKEE